MTVYEGEDWTDLNSHHIEGYSAGGYIKIPLISEVLPGLWVGGCVGGVHLPDDFDHVFSMYKWEEYMLGSNTQRHTVTMYDSSDEPNQQEIDDIATRVLDAWQSGKKVLVHCQAGLNRSNLITGYALIKWGMSADDAIDLLRKERDPMVLCNATFERFLKEVDVNNV